MSYIDRRHCAAIMSGVMSFPDDGQTEWEITDRKSSRKSFDTKLAMAISL